MGGKQETFGSTARKYALQWQPLACEGYFSPSAHFFFFQTTLAMNTRVWATCTVFSFYAGTFPSSFMCSIFLLTHNWWTEHRTKTLNVSHNNRATTMRDNEKRKTSSTMEEDNPSRNATAPKKLTGHELKWQESPPHCPCKHVTLAATASQVSSLLSFNVTKLLEPQRCKEVTKCAAALSLVTNAPVTAVSTSRGRSTL